ncbi:MAG: hypothetical protein ABH862_07150 [Candidatus Omnitrophota bacterium]
MADQRTYKKTLQNGMKKNNKKQYIKNTFVFVLMISMVSGTVFAGEGVVSSDGGPMTVGFAIGGGGEESEICPQGSSVVGMFLHSWKIGDYKAMYDLLDEDSKNDYTFENAKFDFRMLPFKAYDISTIRKRGKDYDFFLTSGDWRDGDKELTKMIISGETFKVIMPSRHSPFKDSAESYF